MVSEEEQRGSQARVRTAPGGEGHTESQEQGGNGHCLPHTPPWKQVTPEFKAKVLEVLARGEFDGMRSSKMSQDELLALLAAFNQAGIHFV